jgi:hypothetical protein
MQLLLTEDKMATEHISDLQQLRPKEEIHNALDQPRLQPWLARRSHSVLWLSRGSFGRLKAMCW